MRLLGRLNKIENQIVAIKAEFDDSVEIPVGVWHCDGNGQIVEGSGPTQRVPIEERDVFGTMLLRLPCQDTEEFETRYSEMAALQESRKEVMSGPGTFDEKLAALDLPESFLNYLNGGKKCEEYQEQIEQDLS